MEDQAIYQTARVNASDVVPGKVFMEWGQGIQILARFPLRGSDWVCFAHAGMAIPITIPLHELLPRLSNQPTQPGNASSSSTWFAPRIGADLTR